MWILALEALVALGLLILIVWLTMGGSRRDDTERRETLPGESNSERSDR